MVNPDAGQHSGGDVGHQEHPAHHQELLRLHRRSLDLFHLRFHYMTVVGDRLRGDGPGPHHSEGRHAQGEEQAQQKAQHRQDEAQPVPLATEEYLQNQHQPHRQQDGEEKDGDGQNGNSDCIDATHFNSSLRAACL